MDRPDWSAPLSMYCNGLLCPKDTKPSALSLQAACHSKSPVYSKAPTAANLTTDTVRESPNPVTIYSKAPTAATVFTTDSLLENPNLVTIYTNAPNPPTNRTQNDKEKQELTELYFNITSKNINNNLTRMYTTGFAYNLTLIQNDTLDKLTNTSNKVGNPNPELDMERYVYICAVAVAKKNMSATPVILSNHCIIPMDKMKQFSYRLRTWLFFQENCFHGGIGRKEVIKFAFYHNVDENKCLSVPTNGIPVGVKTGRAVALCHIPVDVNGNGMFTIDSHVFSSSCSPEVNVYDLIKKNFHIYPFPKYQKVYTNLNMKADFFNIRICRIIYGNSTEDIPQKIPPIKTRHSCLAFMRSGQVSNPMSQNLLARRCQVAKSQANEKYLIMVPERMCAKVIQRSVCLVC